MATRRALLFGVAAGGGQRGLGLGQSARQLAAMRRSSSRGEVGIALRIGREALPATPLQLRAPGLAAPTRPARPASGISNGAAVQPSACARQRDLGRAERLRRAPSRVPARFGEPWPMRVWQQTSTGLSARCAAGDRARRAPSKSWPSTARITVQP